MKTRRLVEMRMGSFESAGMDKKICTNFGCTAGMLARSPKEEVKKAKTIAEISAFMNSKASKQIF